MLRSAVEGCELHSLFRGLPLCARSCVASLCASLTRATSAHSWPAMEYRPTLIDLFKAEEVKLNTSTLSTAAKMKGLSFHDIISFRALGQEGSNCMPPFSTIAVPADVSRIALASFLGEVLPSLETHLLTGDLESRMRPGRIHLH